MVDGESLRRLEGTRAVTADGRLLVLHHATNRRFDSFGRTTDLGYHFGTRSQAQKRRRNMILRGEASEADSWRFVSCALAVRNPLVITDDPGIWNPRWLTAALCGHLDGTDRMRIRELVSEAKAAMGRETDVRSVLDEWFGVLVGALKRSGHDGVVYRNVFESAGKAIEWSWVAFDDGQVVSLGDMDRDALDPPAGFNGGEPLRLRGAGPMRLHQPRGLGPFARKADSVRFREAVERWGAAAGIEWSANYPLDYEPSFGEMRPIHDLAARVGTDSGYFVRVSSRTGEVVLQPFAVDESSDVLMSEFRSESSEMFFEHGSNGHDGHESLVWRPAETLEAFAARLQAVHADFDAAFRGRGAGAFPGP